MCCTFLIISRWILLRNEKIFRQNLYRKSRHIFYIQELFCRLWDNVETTGSVRQATDDSIIRRTRFACWIRKATDTHSEYGIFISFPRQQWLNESATLLRFYVRYMYFLVLSQSPSFSLCFGSFYDFSSSFFVFYFTHLVSYSVFLPFSYTIPLLWLFLLVLIPLSISFFLTLSLTFGLLYFRSKFFDISIQKLECFHLWLWLHRQPFCWCNITLYCSWETL